MKGLIIASFGTTHMEAFGASIGRIENELRKKYPDYYITHSFSSEMVRSRLRKRNINYFNLPEALRDMEEKGIRNITIFSLYVIPGIEYEKIVKQSRVYNNENRLNIKFTTPLLNDESDIEETAKTLGELFSNKPAVKPAVLMGHGTSVEVDSAYSKLQEKLFEMNKDVYIGTVEGSVGFEDVAEKLDCQRNKEVLLTPFLLVAGDHAKNDMGSDEEDSWASMLSNRGCNVEVEIKGLCERKEINNLFYKKLEEIL